jgi:hypothetical protein
MPTRIQICSNCNLHYIDEAKHQRQCAAVPRIRSVEQLCEFCGTRYDLAEGHDCDMKQAPPAAPAIIIARKHQSAPKEHWADKEMRLAAQEIVDGKVKISDQPEEFWDYGQTQTVAEHPRVKEALARLEKEMETPANTQELLEKTAMYHELNERASQPNRVYAETGKGDRTWTHRVEPLRRVEPRRHSGTGPRCRQKTDASIAADEAGLSA